MNKLIPIYSFLAIALIVIVAIYNKSIKGGKLTCNNYILNSYLYVILGIIIIILNMLLNDEYNYLPSIRGIGSVILILILAIILIYLVRSIDPRKTIPKHVAWLAFMILFSAILYPIYMISRKYGVLLQALVYASILAILTTALVFYNPDILKKHIKRWHLMIALILLIIANLALPYIISDATNLARGYYILSIIGLVIFTAILIFYTRILKENSEKCVVPDYPGESMGFVIVLGNMFADVARILLLRRS